MGPSAVQIVVVVGIVLLLFGAGRIAGLGQGLGDGIRNFRDALRGGDEESHDQLPEAGDGADGERRV